MFYTMDEAARRIGVGRWKILYLIEHQKMAVAKFCGHWVLTEADLARVRELIAERGGKWQRTKIDTCIKKEIF